MSFSEENAAMLHEDRQLLGNTWEPEANYKKAVTSFRFRLWITILFPINLIITLLLFSGAFSRQGSDVSTFDSHFVRNYGFASLHHDYDHVWEELVPTGYFSKSIRGRGGQVGTLSM